MITWQRQPSPKSCGQTCVAMLLGVPAEEVIAKIPDKNGTVVRELAQFLHEEGWEADERCRRIGRLWQPPEVALCRVRWGDPRSRHAHWVLRADGHFWDPLARDPLFLRKPGGRVLSYIEIWEKTT